MVKLPFDKALQLFDAFLAKHALPQEKIFVLGKQVLWLDTENNPLCLYLPNEQQCSIQDIQELYDYSLEKVTSDYSPIAFHALAVHKGKTICSLANDFFSFTDEPWVETHHENTLIFSSLFTKKELKIIHDKNTWHALQNKERLLSDLDYLFYITRQEKNNYNYLYRAILADNTDTIKKILSRDNSLLNIHNQFGSTPLANAFLEKEFVPTKELIALLLSYHLDVNLTSQGSTLLHFAADKGYSTIVALLLQAGAHINIQNKSGWTPLMQAAAAGHTEIVKLLLDAGAKIDITGSVLLLKSSYDAGYYDFDNFAKKTGDENKPDNFTALMAGASSGNKEVVKLLLQHGAAAIINQQDILGRTALYYATFLGHEEIVELLLAYNADTNLKTSMHKTALITASRNGNKKIVELLLAHGANIDDKDKHHCSPLRNAIIKGHTEIYKMLLEAKKNNQ
ncbi:MAG: ankyrin repeat domain-containing protein [Candidatus Babeliales bacterium]